LETLWQADTHQLSPPAITETQVLLRTSKSELIALKRSTKLEIQWKVPLNTWWALPPYVAGGKVLVCDGNPMQGEGRLIAFNLVTGKPVWTYATDGMLTQPATSNEEYLFFQNGRKEIVALDLQSGKLIWSIKAERLYTAPVMGRKQLYFVMRGASVKGQPGYYILKALDPASGQTRWDAHVPSRVLVPPVSFENRIYLGTEDGFLLAYEDQSGKPEFNIGIGNEEDPLRTNLVVAEDILLAGTYSANAFGIQVAMPQEQYDTPEAYVNRGEFETAAAAYVLRRDLQAGARLYAEQLHDVPKALAIYEHGGFFKEAAELARSQDLLAEAEEFYKRAGDLENQAEMLLKRGDKLGAARLFEQLSQLDKAARLFEDAGEFAHAIKIYRKLGDVKSVIRVSKAIPSDPANVDWLLEQGKIAEAAEAAISAGARQRAVEIFKQAGDTQRELETLIKLAKKEPERWALERIAELSHKAGQFSEEAEAWEQLKKPRNTAEAYRHAGMQAERRTPGDTERIANLYEKAANFFDASGMEDEEKECLDLFARYRELPVIRIVGQTIMAFKESEWNTVELVISNAGYGVASEVSWAVDEKDFDTRKNDTWHLSHLADGRQKQVEVHILPHKGQVGERVPFYLEWSWKAADGTSYTDHISTSVLVKSKDDTHPTGTPQFIIGAGAKLIQTEKYIEGDSLESGAQKGDKVEIQRGEGGRVSAGEDEVQLKGSENIGPSMICPNCDLPNDADAEFCNACGYKFPKQATKRRRNK
jgi:tetratricopeptide (TPR) repeat protein